MSSLESGLNRPSVPSWAVVVLLVALAAALRVYALGDWSLSGDEVATMDETRALFNIGPPATEPQIARLPRIIPASYVLNRVSYDLVGWNEWGSRTIPALAGIGLVGLAFLLGELTLGRTTAVILAVLVAVSPPHIIQSQTNRFYSLAALFAGATVLLGAVAATGRGVVWTVLSCAGAGVSVLTHTVTAALVPVLGVAATLAASPGTRHRVRASAVVAFGTALLVAAWLLLHVWPLLDGWNEGASWAYALAHSAMASVNMLGWPISLLAGLGVVLMLENKETLRWYWLSCLAVWLSTTLVLPFVLTYQPYYSFPTSLGVLVFAAYAAAQIYGRLRETRPLAGVLWLTIVASLNVPGLASHYVDGSRADARSAIEYVRAHWEAGDRVASPMRAFSYYDPEKQPHPHVRRGDFGVGTLEQLARTGGRLWVVMESGRGGLAADLHRWLSNNASHRRHISRRRFDYFEYSVDVFLIDTKL